MIIKQFRAWDTQLKTYTYSGFGEKTFALFVKRVNCGRYIIEQYAEKKDNKNKLYENDIVKGFYSSERGEIVGVIKFKNGCFFIEPKSGLDIPLYCNDLQIDRIGNIHENVY